MLSAVTLDPAKPEATAAAVLEAWNRALIVHLQAAGPIRDVRATFDALLPFIGTPRPLGEDVRVGSREAQRTGQLWSEVRFDPSFPDAYRHSKNAQPLTSGSSPDGDAGPPLRRFDGRAEPTDVRHDASG